MIELSEKAKSKAQQRFFGMVRAAQKGEMKNPSKEVLDVADDISVKDAKDFAKTKHKGLPNKKEVNEKNVYGDGHNYDAPGVTAIRGKIDASGKSLKVTQSGAEIYKYDKPIKTKPPTPAKTVVDTALSNFNNNEVAEGASIIQGRRSSKKSSYRGATGDHKRDKDGTISASFYDKKPAPTGEKWGDKSGRPKKPSPLEVRARRKKRKEEKAAKAAGSVVQTKSGKKTLDKNSNYEKLKAEIYAKDEAQSKKSREHAKKNNPNYGKSHGGRKYVYTSVNEGKLDKIMDTVRKYSKKRKAEKKPQKAMDAGARGRRILQRREYADRISGSTENVPDDIRDHYLHI